MTAAADPAGSFLSRLEDVASRLHRHVDDGPAGGLTEPDRPSGERWEWGQVWAHLAEFIPYWIGQIELIQAGPAGGPVPFGRTKADPDRIAAIARDRQVQPKSLWGRMQDQLGSLRRLVADMTPDGWSRVGLHPTLGAMPMPRIVDEFLVGHLEAHADQLDGLRQATGSP